MWRGQVSAASEGKQREAVRRACVRIWNMQLRKNLDRHMEKVL